MKKVVVLGGGFGGVAAMLTLVANSNEDELELTLIDRNSFHLFTPSLYEVATSEQPKANIAIPYKDIFPRRVKLIKNNVLSIDSKNKRIMLTDKTAVSYDYLVLALGSISSDFHIPGLTEYSLPLKSLPDALTIRNTIRDKYHETQRSDKMLRIVVGGGGFSGTELAAELTNYRHFLAHHHMRPEDCIEISVIQGSECLLKELDTSVSKTAQDRLKQEHVVLHFGEHITIVTKSEIETDAGNHYPFDVFIWTGGVRANPLAAASGFAVSKRGQVPVSDFLQTADFPEVYAVGDLAEYTDPETKTLIPTVAQVAEEQGKAAGENILYAIRGEAPLPYHYRHFGYVVPLKNHFAVAELTYFHLSGIAGWLLQQIVLLRYLYGILPIHKAFTRWNRFEKELM
jgi:NADH dehydrogenase